MTKIFFIFFGIVILIIAVVLGGQFLRRQGLEKYFLVQTAPQATINNQAFILIVADTPEEQGTGLSGRDSLPEKEGILFVFPEAGEYGFWMRNMKFPIDIIFIRDGKIVTIYHNLKPVQTQEELVVYKPEEPANMVLEINGGFSQKHGFQKGDTVEIKGL